MIEANTGTDFACYTTEIIIIRTYNPFPWYVKTDIKFYGDRYNSPG